MGEIGVAKLVDFNPVRSTDVELPAVSPKKSLSIVFVLLAFNLNGCSQGSAFLIGNCLAVSNKAETAHEQYNLRVVECQLASIVLAMKLGVSQAEALEYETLSQVQKLVGSLGDSEKAVAEHLHEGAYTQDELGSTLGKSLESLLAGSSASLLVLQHNKAGFQLRNRALHVYSEAARVHKFSDECKSQPSLQTLGDLMNASHESCRVLYECSCKELDELVEAFRSAGAIGARLTGAGWGGSAVALVRQDRVKDVLSRVKEIFFKSRISAGALQDEDIAEALFASLPSSGAAILQGI
jgi:N-acetylgalactosamine kinase